jgi:hypothetical protein
MKLPSKRKNMQDRGRSVIGRYCCCEGKAGRRKWETLKTISGVRLVVLTAVTMKNGVF